MKLRPAKPLTKRAEAALRRSITNTWEPRVGAWGTPYIGANCALCDEFDNQPHDRIDPICHGCPIKQRTGNPGCDETPFIDWWDATHYANAGERVLFAAKAELRFLRRVLRDGIAARERARHRAGAAPDEPITICRHCAAAYVYGVAGANHCGKPSCEDEHRRYEAALRGDGRSHGRLHKPTAAGSTPAPATSRHNGRA